MTPLEHRLGGASPEYGAGAAVMGEYFASYVADPFDTYVGTPFDEYVGEPLNRKGLFCADFRRRQAELREGSCSAEYAAAFTGLGALPKDLIDVVGEYTSLDADTVSEVHVKVVDPMSWSKGALWGSTGLAASGYFDIPLDVTAGVAAGAMVAKAGWAGFRNWRMRSYDEHWPGIVGYADSPGPGLWTAGALGLSAHKAAVEALDEYRDDGLTSQDRAAAYQGGLHPVRSERMRSTYNVGSADLRTHA